MRKIFEYIERRETVLSRILFLISCIIVIPPAIAVVVLVFLSPMLYVFCGLWIIDAILWITVGKYPVWNFIDEVNDSF